MIKYAIFIICFVFDMNVNRIQLNEGDLNVDLGVN